MQAGQVSPDGMWRWDGGRWVLTGPGAAEPAITSPAAGRRSVLAIIGAVTAMLGVPFVLAACFAPFVYWSDNSNGPSSSSIIDVSSGSMLWYALEPVAVIVLALLAAVVVLAVRSTARAIAAGSLIAFGLQTAVMFAGYAFGNLDAGRIGPGGPIGVLGGLLILAGGALAIAETYSRR